MATVYTRRDGYVLDLPASESPTGRRLRRMVPSRLEGLARLAMADAGAMRELARLVAAELRDGERQVPTVSEHLDLWLASVDARPSTLAAYRSRAGRIKQVLGRVRLDEVTDAHVDQLVAAMRRDGRAPSGINQVLGVLRLALQYARDRTRTITSMPAIDKVRQEERELPWLVEEQADRLIEHGEGALRVAVALGLLGGLREGELRALRWGDVDIPGRTMTVRRTMHDAGRTGPPKGGKAATVPICLRLADELRRWHHLRSPLVVCHLDGRPWARKHAYRSLIELAGEAEVVTSTGEPLRSRPWHTLRHSFCSHLARAGVPAEHIRRLARHSSLSVTQRYMHLAPSDLAGAVAALDARVGHRLGTAAAPRP